VVPWGRQFMKTREIYIINNLWFRLSASELDMSSSYARGCISSGVFYIYLSLNICFAVLCPWGSLPKYLFCENGNSIEYDNNQATRGGRTFLSQPLVYLLLGAELDLELLTLPLWLLAISLVAHNVIRVLLLVFPLKCHRCLA
jgi:hypothetical protein